MPSGKQINRKALVLTCLGIGALFFIFNDLLGMINGGGIFSFVSAMSADRSHIFSVDVDGASLRTVFIVGCAFITTSIVMLLKADLEKRLTQFLFMAAIIGGGFTLDALYGPKTIQSFMARHGYSRCTMRDHAVGSGKGRVWFDNYVSARTKCFAERST